MFRDTVLKYYSKEKDLNCAETILYAANENYNLNLDKNTLKTMAGFGGGMAVGSTCGAVVGAVAVISIMYTDLRGHQSPKVRQLTEKFYKTFSNKLNYSDCKRLKDVYFEPSKRCEDIMVMAADVLDELVIMNPK